MSLAAAIAKDRDQPSKVRIGTVTSSTPFEVTVQDTIYTSVGFLSSYRPKVGDTVALLGQSAVAASASSWLCLGRIATSPDAFALFVFKTADENRTNTTVFADDAVMFIDYEDSGTYVIDGWFSMVGPTAADFKAQVTFSAGLVRASVSLDGLAMGAPGAEGDLRAVALMNQTTSPVVLGSVGTTVANFTDTQLRGLVHLNAAGRMRLQWAQNTANVTPTTLLQDSWMRLTQVL